MDGLNGSTLAAAISGFVVGIVATQLPSIIAALAMIKKMLSFSSRVEAMYDIELSQRTLLNLELPKTRWMNWGLWKDDSGTSQSYPQACEALASLLGEAGGLDANSVCVDAGCGCGDQMLFFAAQFHVKHITGIDTNPTQIDWIFEHARLASMQDRVSAILGSATILPFESSSVTHVLSLDAAYHFNSRESFFQEAFRILQPRGTLALVDICTTESYQPGFLGSSFAAAAGIPSCNLYGPSRYEQLLREAGFTEIVVKDISANVFAGFAHFMTHHEKRFSSFTTSRSWGGFRAAKWLMENAATGRAPLLCILCVAKKK